MITINIIIILLIIVMIVPEVDMSASTLYIKMHGQKSIGLMTAAISLDLCYIINPESNASRPDSDCRDPNGQVFHWLIQVGTIQYGLRSSPRMPQEARPRSLVPGHPISSCQRLTMYASSGFLQHKLHNSNSDMML